jgi:CheY-like chemotaxis protein
MRSSFKVLVADDNRDAAESLAILLSLSGYSVLVAHSGAAALELASREQPDALILDIGMPELNGYEVARGVREQPWGKQALLLAISGWDKREDRAASSAAGFDVHLAKPAPFEDIERRLQGFFAHLEPQRHALRGAGEGTPAA